MEDFKPFWGTRYGCRCNSLLDDEGEPGDEAFKKANPTAPGVPFFEVHFARRFQIPLKHVFHLFSKLFGVDLNRNLKVSSH